MRHRKTWRKFNDVLEKSTASIISVEEKAA
jgi:hypothetical protein